MRRKSSSDTGPMFDGFETCGKLWPTPTGRDWKDGTAKSCENVPTNGLLGRAVHDSPPLTSFAGAFLAKTSVWRAGVRALRVLVRGFGSSTPASLASYDPDTCSWKTCQGSFPQITGEPLERYSGTWPRSGMMHGGTAYPLPPLARLTDVTAFLSSPTVPTVRAGDGERGGRGDLLSAIRGYDNSHHAPLTPETPRTNSQRTNGSEETQRPAVQLDPAAIGGQLNPTWVEWLMGFPLGWTDLDA